MAKRDTEITHERLMDAWFLIHDLMYDPSTRAGDVSILIEARAVIADKAKKVLEDEAFQAIRMHLEEMAMEANDYRQNMELSRATKDD